MSSVATEVKPRIHVRVWSGCESVRITDMENAGKRGKRCKTVTFQGWLTSGARDEPTERAHTLTLVVREWAQKLDTSMSMEDAERELGALVAQYGPLPEHAAKVYVEDIRGVDAPRPKLTAGVEGQWSARADETGIFVSEDADRNNEPAYCTHDQSKHRAYELAAKVWDQVEACATFYEVGRVLGDAGCKLHYWCRMD